MKNGIVYIKDNNTKKTDTLLGFIHQFKRTYVEMNYKENPFLIIQNNIQNKTEIYAIHNRFLNNNNIHFPKFIILYLFLLNHI